MFLDAGHAPSCKRTPLACTCWWLLVCLLAGCTGAQNFLASQELPQEQMEQDEAPRTKVQIDGPWVVENATPEQVQQVKQELLRRYDQRAKAQTQAAFPIPQLSNSESCSFADRGKSGHLRAIRARRANRQAQPSQAKPPSSTPQQVFLPETELSSVRVEAVVEDHQGQSAALIRVHENTWVLRPGDLVVLATPQAKQTFRVQQVGSSGVVLISPQDQTTRILH